jgi:pimeloyl-ACP methyl ester carboxylesterase
VPRDDPPAVRARWDVVRGRAVRSLTLGGPHPDGGELVVVPGLGALGYLLPTLRECARSRTVRLLDVPGFGSRATARCPSRLPEVAQVVTGWLQEVVQRPVVLAGHSTGAQVALRAAVAAPERVAGLVLGGPTFPPQLRRWPPLAGAVLRTLPHESPREVRATFPDYARGRSRVVALLRSALADAPEQVVPAVTCPVVVVRGERDHVSPPAWGDRLAGLARSGRCLTVPGAHNSVFTHPRQTAPAWLTADG